MFWLGFLMGAWVGSILLAIFLIILGVNDDYDRQSNR